MCKLYLLINQISIDMNILILIVILVVIIKLILFSLKKETKK